MCIVLITIIYQMMMMMTTVMDVHLEPLLGLLRDASFGRQQRWRGRSHGDLRGELGDGGGDEELWHVGWDPGADAVGVWKLGGLAAARLLV